MNRLIARLTLSTALLASTVSLTFADTAYHILKKVALTGPAAWDYLNFDPTSQRLYIANSSQVLVLDATGKNLGLIPDLAGVHSAYPVSDAGVGYTSNGGTNSTTVFELKSLKEVGQVAVGQGPDAVGYDPATGCVFICNGQDGTVSVIEAASGVVAGTIALGGKPEYIAADGKGMVYINLEDKDAVAAINSKTRKLAQTWALPKGSSPSSMAIDKANGKLFIGCRNKTLVVVDTRSGQVVQSLPIGDHVDATVYDSSTGMVFSSCKEGIINVIHQDGPSAYSSVGTIQTAVGAHTLALNPETHQLYVPAVEKTGLTLLIIGE